MNPQTMQIRMLLARTMKGADGVETLLAIDGVYDLPSGVASALIATGAGEYTDPRLRESRAGLLAKAHKAGGQAAARIDLGRQVLDLYGDQRRYRQARGGTLPALTQANARVQFLLAIAKHVPQVLAELRDIAAVPSWTERRALTRAWACSWHLEADWCIDQARATVAQHRRRRIDITTDNWGELADVLHASGFVGDVPVEPAPNRPTAFEGVRAPGFRPAGGVAPAWFSVKTAHMKALIAFQLKGQTFQSIAARTVAGPRAAAIADGGTGRASVQAVHEAVRSLASKLGLTLRPA